jgi:hypothetical protein
MNDFANDQQGGNGQKVFCSLLLQGGRLLGHHKKLQQTAVIIP